MMNFLLLLFISIPSFAASFCERTKADIEELLTQPAHRLAMKNAGGLFGGGVCWWHARLQRSSIYLTEFAPEKNPPTKAEAIGLISHLVKMNQVVTIPGYPDFETFSRDHQEEIQAQLNGWQKKDGFFNFQWIRGISGHSTLSVTGLQKQLQEIHDFHLKNPTPVWLMAQIKGVTAHSFLLIKMNKTEDGFLMNVVDSNQPMADVEITYHLGDRDLQASGSRFHFVPYIGFQQDFQKIAVSLKAHCPQKEGQLASELQAVKPSKIERP